MGMMYTATPSSSSPAHFNISNILVHSELTSHSAHLCSVGGRTAADENDDSDDASDADVFDLEYYEDEYESDEEELSDLDEGSPITTPSPAAQPLDANFDRTLTHVAESSPRVTAVHQASPAYHHQLACKLYEHDNGRFCMQLLPARH